MRHYFIFFFFLFIGIAKQVSAQCTIQGIVTDESSLPLAYANVFIKETLEGASSDEEGKFSFQTNASGSVTLSAMMLGYETYSQTLQLPLSSSVHIKMRQTNVSLNEVEIVASSYQLNGNSQWKKMNAVDLVTTGGSVGDLYNSIVTLPGTQVNAESGKLFIRGGESREAQTYIDDMHVLNPYTTSGENEPVRGRYSPFMFEGMTFSLGGYDPEYAQGLSSVLPLSTKDESPINKYGVNVSSVGFGGGGTKAFSTGSASLNLDYQNLGPYYKIFPSRYDWISPYQKFSGGTQLRYEPTERSLVKLYAGYDYTQFEERLKDRPLHLKENNYYLNTTYRNELGNGYKLFAGAAFSFRKQQVNGASIPNDFFDIKEWEIHLKTKLNKRFSNLFKLQAGMESMIRYFGSGYTFSEKETSISQSGHIDHSIHALFATGSFYLSDKFNVAVSSRAEYTTINKDWNYTPRLAFNYGQNDFYLSAIAGRYTQLTENDYMLQNRALASENCWHYILGGYHQKNERVYRLEAYYKKYDKLASIENGVLNASGDGYSKGIDAFFYDATLIKRLEYRLSYSLNYSERKYRNYPVKDIPQFASRHNASLSLKYNIPGMKSIIGITNRFASGRPYHNPEKEGFMNARTPYYNSLDVSWTFLAHKKLIVFASASNILGRKNIFNYTSSGEAMTNASRNFFFIGVFITLGGNTAYDVSNF
ncbi:hypothetical protein M2459_000629 [Parabacteroides sp. PF5-5]|uniref:TonB-dependent receptor n=1 Tax=unclassified Parabacteroides TaxID=2649774 RepID=UPI0024754E46|nr:MULTISPECIES: TonB-dependent receptor [unclassified Parabacteroides]MDH6303437.1 hypothetical protein [Parabacteroides sp. PH5-39]MDH6314760.1 hypothetical protein [Parabacteroides sp. PF5-13]MDH6318097.1 hypothetical protein [Parabacteroides sp. PH5-13]MDH6321972.1 hypothetical protein [Parabacteroides sp. PH5-8]MDH6326095.1 hypothetical protein [Parabacteroides sp. PH5-41]